MRIALRQAGLSLPEDLRVTTRVFEEPGEQLEEKVIRYIRPDGEIDRWLY